MPEQPSEQSPVPETSAAAITEPPSADQRLLDAHDLARNALVEITASSSIGPIAGHIVEGERVLSLLFECTLSGYPGWHWTVTLARVDADSEPVVLEAELLPGEQALLAPDWVPWSERLAEYQAAQQAAREAGLETEDAASENVEDGEAGDDDEDEDDDGDFGDDELDGIDIDLHDENDSDDDIDLEADDITGAESASLEPGAPEPDVHDLGVDEADDAEGDADDSRGEDPAGS